MSLARFALRTSALQALLGATLVGDNVRDSDITAIDVSGDGSVRTDADRPFIVIYTDDSTAEAAVLRDLRQNGAVDFVCEFGIATPMTSIDEQTGENTISGLGMPATDAAFELTLDLIDRQIVDALTGPGLWAELWRRLSSKVMRIERRRVASAEDGTRIAARQLRIRLEALPDPVAGQDLPTTSVWRQFVSALDGVDPALAEVAGAFLGQPGSESAMALIRRSQGHTEGEQRALAYGPLHPGGDAFVVSAPALEEPAGG